MKRKILSMFAVLAVAVSMVGCAEQIYADVPAENAVQTPPFSESTTEVEIITQTLVTTTTKNLERLQPEKDIPIDITDTKIISEEKSDNSNIVTSDTEINNFYLSIDTAVYPIESKEIVLSINSNDYGKVFIDLNNLSLYKKLKKLEIRNTNDVYNPIELVNYDVLLESESIEELTLQMVSMNYGILSQMKSLTTFNLKWYNTNDWSFLNDLKQVEELYLYRCDIKNASFINDMNSLLSLTLQNTTLRNFKNNKTNSALKKLSLIENELTTISEIERFENLEYLYVSECYINEIEQELKILEEKLPNCTINATYEKKENN